METAIKNKCNKKDDIHNKKNNKELFVVDRGELMEKINDIIINLDKTTKIEDSVSKDNDGVNKKKVRRNKKELYALERNLLISKLDNILELEKNNYAIIYEDLIENAELKKFLNENAECIRKYYCSSGWLYFIPHLHGNVKKNEITLMKSIYKDHGYKFASRSKTIMRDNGIKKKCTLIHFIK